MRMQSVRLREKERDVDSFALYPAEAYQSDKSIYSKSHSVRQNTFSISLLSTNIFHMPKHK